MKAIAYSYLAVLHLVYLFSIYVWYKLFGNNLLQEYKYFKESGGWQQLQNIESALLIVGITGYPFFMIVIMVAGWWFIDKKPKLVLGLTSIPAFLMFLGASYVVYLFLLLGW